MPSRARPAERHFVDLGAVPEKNQFNHLATFQVTGSTDEPQIIEVPVSLTADSPRKFALREKRDPKTDQRSLQSRPRGNRRRSETRAWIDWVEWEGPLSASHADDLERRNDWWITESNRSGRVAPRTQDPSNSLPFQAFRGVEAEDEFIDRLVSIYETRAPAGDSFDDAIRLPLSVILASPGFLYLNEPGDADDAPPAHRSRTRRASGLLPLECPARPASCSTWRSAAN